MGDERVLKAVEKGPKPIVQEEADWFIQQADLQFSRPQREAFALGIELAQGMARQAWVASDDYVQAKERLNTGLAYATSAPKATPRTENISGAPTPAMVRQWAVEHGIEVSPRGRLSKDVMDAYVQAMAAQQARTSPKPKTTKAKSLSERRAERRGATKAKAPTAAAPRTRSKSARAQVTATPTPAPKPTRNTRHRGGSSRTVVQPGEVEY